jgi:hypothetical protein
MIAIPPAMAAAIAPYPTAPIPPPAPPPAAPPPALAAEAPAAAPSAAKDTDGKTGQKMKDISKTRIPIFPIKQRFLFFIRDLLSL